MQTAPNFQVIPKQPMQTIPNYGLTPFAAGGLTGEAYTGGILAGLRITNQFDHLQRRTNVALINGQGVTLASTAYRYDSASRLQSVKAGTNSAVYSYIANSPLVGQLFFTNGSALRMTTTKTFDFLNRLDSIASVSSASSVVSFSYSYNLANQRTLRREADQSLWRFDYDPLGQVKSGKRYWSDWTPVAGQQFEYSFDQIGNRTSTKAGGDDNGTNLRQANYYPNLLNQYWSNTVPGAVDVMGVAFATSSVTVNALATYRKGEYFRKELPVNNNAGPVWTNITVTATGQATVSGNAAIALALQDFQYDLDGNLTQDGLWTYGWDAENRLTSMESQWTVPEEGRKRLEFKYDHQSRRIEKVVYAWSSQTWSYVPTYTNRFVYDGWNLIAVLDGNNAPVLSFAWGTDLSGSLQGAGGVGGLLNITVHSGANAGTYFCCYDGNGNVVAIVKATDGSVVARYEYGPFGEVLRATGPMAKANPFRFSTKYQDEETDLVYYGYRYYNASTGRWLSRDPIGERGGRNLYCTAHNSPLAFVDPLGLTHEVWNGGTNSGITFTLDVEDLGPRDESSNDHSGETSHSWTINVWATPLGCKDGDERVAARGMLEIKYWYMPGSEAHESHHVDLWKEAYRNAYDTISWVTGFCVCPEKARCLAKLGRAIAKMAQAQGAYWNHEYDVRSYGNKDAEASLTDDLKAWEEAKRDVENLIKECSKL